MPRETRDLGFAKGFLGPPTPPNQTGEACPGWKNLRLENGGAAFAPYYGYARKVLSVLDDPARYPTALRKRVVLFDANAWLSIPGIGVAVVDFAVSPRRVLNLRIHENAVPSMLIDPDTKAPWDSASKPALVLDYLNKGNSPQGRPALHRMGPHEYPTMLQLQGQTFLFDKWSLPQVFDGLTLREAGLRPPRMAPQLVTERKSSTDVELATTVYTVTASGITYGVSCTAQAGPPYYAAAGTVYNRVSVLSQNSVIQSVTDKYLCYKNVTFSWDAAKYTRLQFYFRLAGKNALLPANSLSVVFADGTALSGNVKLVPIWKRLSSEKWYLLDLTWPDTAGTFSVKSIGWKLNDSVPAECAGKAYGDLRFFFGGFRAIEPQPGPFTGKVMTCFCWHDSKTGLVSDPSPYSNILDLGTGSASLRMIFNGFRGFWDKTANGMAEDAPSLNTVMSDSRPHHPNPDRLLVYLSKPEWGNMDDGSPMLRLITPSPGMAVMDALKGDAIASQAMVTIGNNAGAEAI